MLHSSSLKIVIALFTLFFLLRCGSPARNKVIGSQDPQSKQNVSLSLSSGLQVQPFWLEGPFPTVSRASKLMVVLSNSQGQLVDLQPGQGIAFYATMPSMGHPLDQPGDFVRLEKGIYLNASITFNMGGDWLMELWLLDASSFVTERITWPASL